MHSKSTFLKTEFVESNFRGYVWLINIQAGTIHAQNSLRYLWIPQVEIKKKK